MCSTLVYVLIVHAKKPRERLRERKKERNKERKSERFCPEDNLSVKNGLEPYLQACQDRRQEYRK